MNTLALIRKINASDFQELRRRESQWLMIREITWCSRARTELGKDGMFIQSPPVTQVLVPALNGNFVERSTALHKGQLLKLLQLLARKMREIIVIVIVNNELEIRRRPSVYEQTPSLEFVHQGIVSRPKKVDRPMRAHCLLREICARSCC
ncbi:hypothetical protein [Comamonas thiooxydans]|uniref:hypothetical protein n=1 Tax=Comamonas thiooxydans TaxID=363952 RepID=UPI00311FCA96